MNDSTVKTYSSIRDLKDSGALPELFQAFAQNDVALIDFSKEPELAPQKPTFTAPKLR